MEDNPRTKIILRRVEKEVPQEEPEQWFAMRATYRNEMLIRDKLKALGITTFLPLVMVEKKVGARKKRMWVPAINNLIFVYGKKSEIQAFKNGEKHLQYLCKKTTVTFEKKEVKMSVPIVVPDADMAAFIRLYEGGKTEITDDLEIISSIKPGQRVRVTDGPFEGLVGTFQRLKGHRSKSFIITLDQIACISTTEISPSMVEIVE